MKKLLLTLVLIAAMIPNTTLAAKKDTLIEIKHFPLDSTDGILSQIGGLTIDENTSSDGKASLKVTAKEPVMLNLFKTGDIDVENATLLYTARIKTEDFKGRAFLEMWCSFKDKGRFFSRDLASPVTGDTDWVTEETPFYLKEGENPEEIELNIIIDGTGTLWIDDVKILKAPLPKDINENE